MRNSALTWLGVAMLAFGIFAALTSPSHSSVNAPTWGVPQACTSPAMVEAIFSEPTDEAAAGLFYGAVSAGMCAEFPWPVAGRPVREIKLLAGPAGETVAMWEINLLDENEMPAQRVYWIVDLATSEKAKRALMAAAI